MILYKGKKKASLEDNETFSRVRKVSELLEIKVIEIF